MANLIEGETGPPESGGAAQNLPSLMTPKSIAVIGASQRRSRGSNVLLNLKSTNFAGSIYGINPKYDETQGFPCFPSVSAISNKVDCVVAAIPADGVADALEEAFAAGTRAAVVLSSGFGEGGHDNTQRVTRLRALADRGMAICGPNCYGILNRSTGAAPFSGQIAEPLEGGPVSVVSQSGGFSNAISTPLISDRGIGCGFIISCGNQIGVAIEDYFEYLLEDPGTRVIAAFVEGFRKPQDLARIGERAQELDKPIIVLKSGRSEMGKRAAFSHTGSLAGNARVLSELLRRYGYVQVLGIDELIETVALFTVLKRRRRFSREVLVVTGSGGEGSHVADAAELAGVGLSALEQRTRDEIENLLPEFGTAANPVDGTGAMFENPEVFPALFASVMNDAQDGVVAVNLSGRSSDGRSGGLGAGSQEAFARTVADWANKSDKLIVAYGTSALGATNRELIGLLSAAGVPYLAGTQYAMKAVASLYRYCTQREKTADRQLSVKSAVATAPTPRATLPIGNLSFLDASSLLGEFGIPIVETAFAKTAEEAVEAAETLGYPVAVKVEAAGLAHKSDKGGVVLNCMNPAEVRRAFGKVTVAVSDQVSAVGALVQPMVPAAIEAIAGITVDPAIGPAILFGLGGVFVEVIKDTSLRIPPLPISEALEMIEEIQGRELLHGARGTEPADIDAIARVLVALGNFAETYKSRLVSLDINPLMVGASGCTAVDLFVEMRDG